MLFGKLLPTEGNFFVMFNQHADRIVEAAHAFSNLVANYGDANLRDKYNQEVDNAERAADRIGAVEYGALVFDQLEAIERKRVDGVPVLDCAAAP